MCKSHNNGNLVEERKKITSKKKKNATRSDEDMEKKSLYSEAHLRKIFALKTQSQYCKGHTPKMRERETERARKL